MWGLPVSVPPRDVCARGGCRVRLGYRGIGGSRSGRGASVARSGSGLDRLKVRRSPVLLGEGSGLTVPRFGGCPEPVWWDSCPPGRLVGRMSRAPRVEVLLCWRVGSSSARRRRPCPGGCHRRGLAVGLREREQAARWSRLHAMSSSPLLRGAVLRGLRLASSRSLRANWPVAAGTC